MLRLGWIIKIEFELAEEFFNKLIGAEAVLFPKLRGKLNAPVKLGVYVIHDPKGHVVHVGRTPIAKGGIAQRLRNHMSGVSSFSRNFLNGDGSKLREKYTFKCVEVENPRIRALLEAYAVGRLCPKHLGLG